MIIILAGKFFSFSVGRENVSVSSTMFHRRPGVTEPSCNFGSVSSLSCGMCMSAAVRLPELRFLSLLDCLSDFSSWSWRPPRPRGGGGRRPKMDSKPSTIRERKPGRAWRRATVAVDCLGPEMNGQIDTDRVGQSAERGRTRATYAQEKNRKRTTGDPNKVGSARQILAPSPSPLDCCVAFCPTKRRK